MSPRALRLPAPRHDARYKMLGNSFAVMVIHWIGQQIQHAHDRSSEIQRLRDAATQATEQLRAALATN